MTRYSPEVRARAGLTAPDDTATLGIVGLSRRETMAALVPGLSAAERDRLAELYKQSFIALREETGGEALTRLDRGGWLISVATGKGRRGLDHVVRSHGLDGLFVATQTADDAPSKPHPGMVLNCLAATGVAPERLIAAGAERIVERFEALDPVLATLVEGA